MFYVFALEEADERHTVALRNRSLSLWALVVIQCAHGSAGLRNSKGRLTPRRPRQPAGPVAHCRWNKADAMAQCGTRSVRPDRRDCRGIGSRYAVFAVPGFPNRARHREGRDTRWTEVPFSASKEATGSARTSSILGRSTAPGPSHILKLSHRSTGKCIDTRALAVRYIESLRILRAVRGSQFRSEQMTMPATDTADGRRDSVSSILESGWQHHMFPRPRIENRTDGTAESNILSPQLHVQTAPAPIKYDRAF